MFIAVRFEAPVRYKHNKNSLEKLESSIWTMGWEYMQEVQPPQVKQITTVLSHNTTQFTLGRN